jgi:pyruvate/2-oxoglutarate dehydrogenase complex dihydrolipoamide dehydrogenase (E3) component
VRTFDVVVLGAGPSGEVAAGRLADGGLKVAIVEDRLVGGECSFWACMPSKALLRPYEALAEARRVEGAAEAITGSLDVQAVLDRRDEIIHGLDDSGMLPWLEDQGIELVRGRGRITGEGRVSVARLDGATDELHATRAVFVAGGTFPKIPEIPGMADVEDPWTNRDATTVKAIPDRLAIMGGGVVGCEMAQAFQTLGAQVTLIEGDPTLLPREEPFAAEQVTAALEDFGVEVIVGQNAERVEQRDAVVAVTTEDGTTVEADRVLVALGRVPDTAGLGVEELGLAAGEPIPVDEHCRVPGHPWLYAVGDINGRSLFTHMGKYQARIAADHVLGHDRARSHGADGPLSPRVIFTEPQVAAVGHTEASAREAGLGVTIVETETSGNAGGSYYGHGATGTSRLVIDRERRLVVGATFTGAEIAEMLHAATIAIVGEVPLDLLRHATPVFPTRSEVWLKLLGAAGV